jgi:toxin ParE1/3/4
MNVWFHPDALAEYIDSLGYYETAQEGLGDRFACEVEAAVAAVCRNPDTWRKVDGDVRRFLCPHFPFGIYYTIESDEIKVWAVMHLRRKPGYWKSRRT